MKRMLLVLLAAGCVAVASATSAAASSEPLRLSFDKSYVGNGVWKGTVEGDISGDLTTVLRELRVTGAVWQVRFDWIVSAGDQSFAADLRGVLNNETGAVVMDGTVADGYLVGARVHEEGQLVDAATLSFQGSIQLIPATAG
jgi:hypothetical protein